MSLLTDPDAVSAEQRRCGDLDGDVDGDIVWMACDCGASIVRRVDEDDDARVREQDARHPLVAGCS